MTSQVEFDQKSPRRFSSSRNPFLQHDVVHNFGVETASTQPESQSISLVSMIARAAALVGVALLALLQIGRFSFCDAFMTSVAPQTSNQRDNARRMHRFPSRTILMERRKHADIDETEKDLSQLPALGAGSLSLGQSLGTNSGTEFGSGSSSPIADTQSNSTSTSAFVSTKFELQYTCNVCETRNRVLVSRQAYREGMVIAICKGCDSKHWIADNLDPTLASNNIEELFAANATGQENDQQVNRVSQDVYDIERVWQVKGGEMQDEDGNPVLE